VDLNGTRSGGGFAENDRSARILARGGLQERLVGKSRLRALLMKAMNNPEIQIVEFVNVENQIQRLGTKDGSHKRNSSRDRV
jgi:hypothetical protein